MESVKGKVVLITGASSGIGAATAVLFAKYGSKLVLTGRNEDNLKTTAYNCESQGLEKDKIIIVTGDISKDEDLKGMVDTAVSTFGTIDILVNNAGSTFAGSLLAPSLDNFDTAYRTILRPPVVLATLVAPYLKENKGAIVNVSSILASRPIPQVGVYGVMKAGLGMVTKELALELAPHGVRVNEVRLGQIRTPIFKAQTGLDGAELEEFHDASGKSYPLGRVGLPEEVAQAIVFLASDAASFTTGESLKLDGGMLQTADWAGQTKSSQ